MNALKPKELESVLKAFANRRRIEILQFLKTKKEAFVGSIAEKINLSLKSTSRHLAILYTAGLIEKTQKSTLVYYRIANDLPEVARRVIALF
ncbi:metalloregulator ArsR/SmtB family transcription factor [Patescibacteria group bacterium]|nr:metalloregulator ArsR/SmtB family transcription factor [Patescibacteria group bacterium]